MNIDKLKNRFVAGAWLTDVKHYFNKINEIIEKVNNIETPKYKVYSALLTQTETNPPVATVLENTLGLNPTFYYVGPGGYYLEDLAGLFTPNKTFVTGGINFAGRCLMNAYINDTTNIEFESYGIPANTGIDGWFENTPIEIRVYN